MREIRLSGSEGGGVTLSLPLSTFQATTTRETRQRAKRLM